jgi:tripartite-type tricarboxylate transporter receptor subunit TctC
MINDTGRIKSLLITFTATSFLSIAIPQLGAQGYPNQPINLVIPLAPGDAADVTARTIGEELAKHLRIPVVPVNRPGAGATIGTDSVARARKDGYTILLTPNAAVVSSRILNPETVPYDPLKDLTPLGLVTRTPILIAVRHDAPYKNFGEMVEFVKKNPGKVRVGTIGPGSAGHFAVEIINSLTGAGLTTVPFKGGAPGITALLGGHVEGVAFTLGALSGHLKSGAMRGLVSSSRSPQLPEVPTLSELGYRQNLLGVWLAFFGPAGLPAEVTKVLLPAIEKAAKDSAIASKLAGLGIVQDYAPPDKLVAEMREEYRTVEEIAKKSGLVK